MDDNPLIPVSPEMLAAGRSAAGGWTREQLALIGVPWPPPKGWQKDVCRNKLIRKKDAEFFAERKRPKPHV